MDGSFFSAPSMSEEELKKEREELPEHEKRSIDNDLSGVAKPCSSPDKVGQLVEELLEVVSLMPLHEKLEYEEARSRGAEFTVVGPGELNLFLQAESEDVKAAARRVVSYWKHRVSLFDHDAYLPLSTETLLRSGRDEDIDFLRCGYFTVLPQLDEYGRTVLFTDHAKLRKKYACQAQERNFWCVVHEALREGGSGSDNTPEDADSSDSSTTDSSSSPARSTTDSSSSSATSQGQQQHHQARRRRRRQGEMVILSSWRFARIENCRRKNDKSLQTSLEKFLPLRVVGWHSCHTSRLMKELVQPTILKSMGKRIRHRVRDHSGDDRTVLASLCQNGLPQSVLPRELGGSVILQDPGHSVSRRMAKIKKATTTDKNNSSTNNKTEEDEEGVVVGVTCGIPEIQGRIVPSDTSSRSSCVQHTVRDEDDISTAGRRPAIVVDATFEESPSRKGVVGAKRRRLHDNDLGDRNEIKVPRVA